MLIDTHCHLDAREFDADRPTVLDAARAAGVRMIIVPAVEVGNLDAVSIGGQQKDRTIFEVDFPFTVRLNKNTAGFKTSFAFERIDMRQTLDETRPEESFEIRFDEKGRKHFTRERFKLRASILREGTDGITGNEGGNRSMDRRTHFARADTRIKRRHWFQPQDIFGIYCIGISAQALDTGDA